MSQQNPGSNQNMPDNFDQNNNNMMLNNKQTTNFINNQDIGMDQKNFSNNSNFNNMQFRNQSMGFDLNYSNQFRGQGSEMMPQQNIDFQNQNSQVQRTSQQPQNLDFNNQNRIQNQNSQQFLPQQQQWNGDINNQQQFQQQQYNQYQQQQFNKNNNQNQNFQNGGNQMMGIQQPNQLINQGQYQQINPQQQQYSNMIGQQNPQMVQQFNQQIMNNNMSNSNNNNQFGNVQTSEIQKRRRARNDPNNRDYKCPCGKSYLSYPALYTHIKQKHGGKAPGEVQRPNNQNSNRGRPKGKVQMNPSNNDQEEYEEEDSEELEALNVIDGLHLYIYSSVNPSILQDNNFLSGEQMKNAFPAKEFFGENNEDEYKPLYDQFCMIVDQQVSIPEEEIFDSLYNTTINTILAMFLYQFSQHAQENLIKEMGFYLCMFRKTLNKYKPEVIFHDFQDSDEEDGNEEKNKKTIENQNGNDQKNKDDQEKTNEKLNNSENNNNDNDDDKKDNNQNDNENNKQNDQEDDSKQIIKKYKEDQLKLQTELGDKYDYCEHNYGRSMFQIINDFIKKDLPNNFNIYKQQTKDFKLINENFMTSHIIKVTQMFNNWVVSKRYSSFQLEIVQHNDLQHQA